MSMANNKTPELWQSFMPKRFEIKNNLSTNLFSMQIYDPSHDFSIFNPHAIFEKWAAIEVNDFFSVPNEMESIILRSGLYAVFLHKGPAREGHKTFQYIFGTWLPNSDYAIDSRPHFEILDDRYKNNDPTSEEEIWIPIKKRRE